LLYQHCIAGSGTILFKETLYPAARSKKALRSIQISFNGRRASPIDKDVPIGFLAAVRPADSISWKPVEKLAQIDMAVVNISLRQFGGSQDPPRFGL
jgi:hypothetical protein